MNTNPDRDTLRQRLAEQARTVRLRLGPNAIAMAQRGEPIILNLNEADDLADAVLAVLPEPADRAAVLREAANALAAVGLEDSLVSGPRAWAEAIETLRRMADEAQPAKPDRCPHGCDTSTCPCLACEADEEPDGGPCVAGEQQNETPEANGCWCGHPEDRHWAGSTRMTFPDGCHDCRGWNGAHGYGQELPWLPEGDEPAAGVRQDGAQQ